MARGIGIDLGTTYSAVAYVDDSGTPTMIPNAEGRNTTPSVVFFEGHELLVGSDAKTAGASVPTAVAQFMKRWIGDSTQTWQIGGRRFTATELSAEILAQLKRDAEAFFGEPVTEAVITVPAYFADAQRSNTIAAGRAAGLNVRGIINEPTAAAIDFGLGQVHAEQLILVYDLGGGTFDVTLMRVCPGSGREVGNADPAIFEIVATDGNAMLGGKDWDDCIINHVAEAFERQYRLDPRDDPLDYQTLVVQAELAKQQLSARQKVAIDVHCGGKHLAIALARDEFEDMTRHLLDTTRATVRDVLRAASKRAEEIGTVLLVGGMTRLPMVRAMLQEEFGRLPQSAPNPDETVARGAAIYAAVLAATSGQEGQAAPLAGRLGAIKIDDVTSHTLGTLAKRGESYIRSPIIHKNTRIPCREQRADYATGRNNQDALTVPVLQGESEDPTKCELTACWEFFGIPARPAGQSRLRVTFGYDVNGIVEVEAEDVLTGQQLQRRLKQVSGIEELLAPPPPPVWVALCIDVSGSMSGPPLREAQRGAIEFVDTLLGSSRARTRPVVKRLAARAAHWALRAETTASEGSTAASDEQIGDPPAPVTDCQVGIVTFDDSSRVVCQRTNDRTSLLGSINSLEIDGGTDIAAGIRCAHRQVLAGAEAGARLEIVLLTDGGSDAAAAIAAANEAKKQGIFIRCIGCGSGVDRALLGRLASDPDQTQFVDTSQLCSSLANIAVQISEGLRSQ